jgi:aspartyl-tRNA(Asn)/glutamyl-tRNA(Gln) amidotransferase subunit B
MEEGSLRADVNVSVRKPGEKLGTRCEIKNMNSLRFIGQAIEYEARRQIDVLEDGGTIHQNTLLYDPKTGKTAPMRSKEEAHDYRYFPDPDLLPLVLAETFVEKLQKALPELPDEKRARFIKDYGLSAYDAGVLIADRASADFFEAVAKGRDAKLAANWIMGDFFAALNKTGRDISDSPVSAGHLGELIGLISSNVISGRIAKEVFEIMLQTADAPAKIVEERGLKQVTDTGAIEKVVDDIIAANPKQVEQVQIKPKTLGWFVGQVMKATGGKANPDAVNAILRQKLNVPEEV